MKESRKREGGMTLIELMIGVGLVALIGYAAARFFSNVTQSDAEVSAKAKAQSELAILTTFLDKDLKFREMDKLADLCTQALCTDITINRLAPGGGTYQVHYASSCAALPTNTIYKDLKFDSTSLSGLDSQCIKSLNCPQGQYPLLTITAPPGVTQPAYPKKTPTYDRRTAYNLVGAALCASKTITTINGATTVSQNRIILEGAFLGPNKSIRVERKETVFSSNNMAKIQMLPN